MELSRTLPRGFTLRKEGLLETAPELGIGILGYGQMGKAHSNAYCKIPYIFWPPTVRPRRVAMCGRREDRVAEAVNRYGYEGYYSDWREMVQDPRIQVLDNCAPHALHCEPSIAAAAFFRCQRAFRGPRRWIRRYAGST
jgi:hypothetical protein